MVANGSKILFLEDCWCGDAPLFLNFLDLYTLTDFKGAKLMELWNTSDIEGS